MTAKELADSWRKKAAYYRSIQADDWAAASIACAEELDQWARELAKAESERYERIRVLPDDGTQEAILFEIRNFLEYLGVPEDKRP